MQVSSAFVVVMGMGVTFVGLTCIIFLTMLMGKILSKPEAPKPAAAAAVPAAPAVPADGLTDEVKVAIMAAIEGVTPEKYAASLDFPKLLTDAMELVTDNAFLDFLSSQETGKGVDAPGSASGSSEAR